MSEELLLVGSVPYETTEEVMAKFGGALGRYLPALPDGEVAERKDWVVRLCYQVFHGHPDIETIARPASIYGVEQLVPSGGSRHWRFRVKDGIDEVKFGNPGWRLGYAKDAVTSYFVFRTLRDRGVLPPDLRFQVCLPLTNSAVSINLADDADSLVRLRAGYETSLKAEIAMIVAKIPPSDLAIQFDASWEITDVNGGVAGLPAEGAIERNVASIRNIIPEIPTETLLGYHVCYGTWGGWPRFAPDGMAKTVAFVNAAVIASGRKVDWVHIPTLDRSDAAFYEPFADLDLKGGRPYLGMIHNMSTFAERLAIAREFLPEFGLGAPCGFGRELPESLPALLQDHLDALDLAGMLD